MGMKLFYNFDSDGYAASAPHTEVGFLPSSVQNSALSTKWQDDGTVVTAELIFDAGAPVTPDAFAILGHDFINTDFITIDYASDSGFTTDTGSFPVTWRESIMLGFIAVPVSRRYWKLKNIKLVQATRSVGRFVLGTSYELTYSLKAPSYRIGAGKTTTRTVRTQGGQLYADIGTTLKQMKGKLPGLPQTDHDELQNLINTNQTGIPFIAAAEYDNFPEQKTIYGTFDTIPLPTDVTINRWEYPWSMTEQK